MNQKSINTDAQGLASLIVKVKDSIKQQFAAPQWVIAEISDVNMNRSGHCYLELIEKDPLSSKIIAKSRATIWAFAFRMIKPYFETTTKETFRAGIKVLLKVSVEFHELYGFSLNIQDIDPQYTLGDLARKRTEILDRLAKEGVLDLNKEIPFPMVPQHIAVVSSETAAGYGDFIEQLANNIDGYHFYIELFQATMQGDKTAETVTAALYEIFDRVSDFDLVVIIRGGGAKSELSSFDDYDLAFAITQFPIPVITGIGHDRDDTVVDAVAHKKLKTPTAVADFLIERIRDFDIELDRLGSDVFSFVIDLLDQKQGELSYFWDQISNSLRDKMEKQMHFINRSNQKVKAAANQLLNKKTSKLQFNQSKIGLLAKNSMQKSTTTLNTLNSRLNPCLKSYFDEKNNHIKLLDSKRKLLDPQNVLNRGYAIVKMKDKLIKEATELSKGDQVKIQLSKGNIDAQIIE